MNPLPDPRAVVGLGPRARVLLLGTWHFAANEDHLKQEQAWDVHSDRFQAEVEEVVERLAAFRPSKVRLERPAEREEYTPEHLTLSHGVYLDLARSPDRDERLLVIIGAGHVPLLRHCVQTSPDHELVEVADILG